MLDPGFRAMRYSASSSIWRRNSSGKTRILDLPQDVRTKITTEGFHSDKFSLMLQNLLQKE